MLTTLLLYLLIFVEAVVSFLLIGIILIQKTKSQGMGLAFGAGMGESLFGAQVGNVLTKATVWLAIIFLVNTTLLAMIGVGRRSESVTDSIKAVAPVTAQPAAAPEPLAGPAPVAAPVVDLPPAMNVEVPAPAMNVEAQGDTATVAVPAPAQEPAPAPAPAP